MKLLLQNIKSILEDACIKLGKWIWLHVVNVRIPSEMSVSRCGSRIWSRGGPQLLRPKVADVVKRSRTSKASILQPGSRGRLRALEAFGFLMLKYAFSYILGALFLSFLTGSSTPKTDINSTLHCTSNNPLIL